MTCLGTLLKQAPICRMRLAQVRTLPRMIAQEFKKLGFVSHLIEKQLSHADRNRTKAVYNYTEYLPERKKNDTGLG